jgi:uncharacterized protein
MHVFADDLRLSPSDFSAFLGCRLRTGLDLAVARGLLAKPRSNAVGLQALRDRGEQHEQAYVQHLRDQGLTVVEIDTEAATAARAAATVQAMHQGADAIIQAALVNDTWTGYADVLRRVETASALGAWSYEPYDTKLARETRGGTILQLALYIDVLAGIQGLAATHFHVVTPAPSDGCSFTTHSYRYDDFAAYVRLVRDQFARTLALGHDIIQAANYPEPVEQCDVCRWWERCNGQRRKDDHLSFIAGVTRANREELVARGYPTLTAAAGIPLPIPFKPSRGSTDTYVRLRDQARLQHLQRTRKAPVHELLPVIDGQGLSRLPEPSPGDLFLDLEGARFAREGGREYLFGLSTNGSLTAKPGAHATNGGDSPSQYDCWWAFDDTEERAAFEALIDRIMQAWDADPNLHIYHFGHYEPSTLKRLMGRYATRGDELDRLLRAERFVDLHVVVRQALRAGVESYSIKQLEQFYEFTRDVLLHDAGMNLHAIELSLESNAAAAIPDDVRAAVRGYNRDDCRSTLALRNWLERLRAQVVDGGAEIHRPTPKEGEASEAIGELEQRQRDARERILAAISSDASTPEHPQHPNWLLAYLIDWHRREDKCAYWEFYRLRDLPECDLFDEAQAIAGLHHVARLSEERYKKGTLKSVVDRYAYPLQETEIRRRKGLRLPGGDPIGSLLEHDRVARTVDIQKGPKVADVHPPAVYQAEVIGPRRTRRPCCALRPSPTRSIAAPTCCFAAHRGFVPVMNMSSRRAAGRQRRNEPCVLRRCSTRRRSRYKGRREPGRHTSARR